MHQTIKALETQMKVDTEALVKYQIKCLEIDTFDDEKEALNAEVDEKSQKILDLEKYLNIEKSKNEQLAQEIIDLKIAEQNPNSAKKTILNFENNNVGSNDREAEACGNDIQSISTPSKKLVAVDMNDDQTHTSGGDKNKSKNKNTVILIDISSMYVKLLMFDHDSKQFNTKTCSRSQILKLKNANDDYRDRDEQSSYYYNNGNKNSNSSVAVSQTICQQDTFSSKSTPLSIHHLFAYNCMVGKLMDSVLESRTNWSELKELCYVQPLLSKDGIVHEDGLFCVIEELLHEEKIQLSNRENIQFIVSGNLELLQKSKGTLIKVSINFCILYRYHLTLKYIDRLWIN